MIMKKNLIGTAVAMAMGTAGISMCADAALVDGSTLGFVPAANSGVQPAVGTGAWFSMKVSSATTLYTGINSFNGLILGSTQGASGSHLGTPGCSPASSVCTPTTEVPGIDDPWGFFGNTGMHQSTVTAASVLAAAGNAATVNMSGWGVTWNGLANIPMNAGAWGGTTYTAGVANVVCAVDCSVGDTYTLDYHATVPAGDPSNFGGVKYGLHLEGTIGGATVVPVPAAVWLFGSGLLGLVGVARRRKVVA